MSSRTTIDVLLNLVPDHPNLVLSHLQANPSLASKQDGHGYSLLHAAASYEQLDLLRTLVQEYCVDPNIKDEDGETCLFNAESVDVAKELVNLGVRTDVKNDDGQTAAEKLDDEDEQPQVAAYLREIIGQPSTSLDAAATIPATETSAQLVNGDNGDLRPPPPLPKGIHVSLGTMHADEAGGEPDPEFRRRIEELAARQDFEGEDSQRELRHLVSDAVSGINDEGQGSATRRRLD